jgi:hypothetical protein
MIEGGQMEAKKPSGGTIVRSDDGTVYFVRDEILEMTKITEPEMAEFCAQLLDRKESNAEGFDLASGGRVDTLAFTGPFDTSKVDPSRVASSTVMCPGNMKIFEFEARSPFRSS